MLQHDLNTLSQQMLEEKHIFYFAKWTFFKKWFDNLNIIIAWYQTNAESKWSSVFCAKKFI